MRIVPEAGLQDVAEESLREIGHDRRRAGGTLMIRWLYEDASEPNADGERLVGTVLDLGGRTLGHFAGMEALIGLLDEMMTVEPTTARFREKKPTA